MSESAATTEQRKRDLLDRRREIETFVLFSPWRDEVPTAVPETPVVEWGALAWARFALALLEATCTPPDSTAASAHPEDTCEECGGRNVVWFAPNDLWNRVMRGDDRGAPDIIGIVCPTCFILRAEASGVEATGWLVQPEVIHA